MKTENNDNIAAGRGGLSLAEIILAVGISSIMVVLAIRFGVILANFGTLIGNQAQSAQDAEIGIGVMATDIRSMGPSSLGAYPLESAATNSMVFYSDVNQDGLYERVRYFLGTSTLQKGIIKPFGNPLVYTIASETVTTAIPNVLVAQSIFDYFDTNYTGTQSPLAAPIDPTAVRIIRPTIVADVSTSSAPKPVRLSDTITVRNLRTN